MSIRNVQKLDWATVLHNLTAVYTFTAVSLVQYSQGMQPLVYTVYRVQVPSQWQHYKKHITDDNKVQIYE